MRSRSDLQGFARIKEISLMRRIKSVFVVAAATVAMLIASIPPALATPEDSIVFFPVTLGNGATYSCTGGPPFVSSNDSTGNCSVRQIGQPTDLVCDVPTNITFLHDQHEFAADGSLCRSATG
jgi:hypothetical protein